MEGRREAGCHGVEPPSLACPPPSATAFSQPVQIIRIIRGAVPVATLGTAVERVGLLLDQPLACAANFQARGKRRSKPETTMKRSAGGKHDGALPGCGARTWYGRVRWPQS